MTNEEFRKSLSKEQLRFLQGLYDQSLVRTEDSLEMCGGWSYGDNLMSIRASMTVASIYKNLLVEDKLDERFYKCEQRLENL